MLNNKKWIFHLSTACYAYCLLVRERALQLNACGYLIQRDIHLTPSLFASLLRVAPVYNSILMKFSLCCVTGCSRFYRTFPTDEFRPVTNSLLSRIDKTRDPDWTSCLAKKIPVYLYPNASLSICWPRKNHKESI